MKLKMRKKLEMIVDENFEMKENDDLLDKL